MASPTKPAGLHGLRVLTLESRRAKEMAKLIENHGGRAVVAPSMREVPLESNTEALAFGRALAAGELDVIIFLTGVGTRALTRVVERLYPVEQFARALRKVAVVARGPKPIAALQELNVPVRLAVPEPNTWRDLLRALDEHKGSLPLAGRRVAVQEYGASNPELIAGLAERGAVVMRVPVYQWALPEDLGPLRAAVEAIARAEIDMALFTTSIQIVHLLRVAREMHQEQELRRGFAGVVVGSIGPVTSEELRDQAFHVDFEPAHPKMGFLVNEAAQHASAMLNQKRRGSSR
jgi:uroporphyrinogen-III synthase